MHTGPTTASSTRSGAGATRDRGVARSSTSGRCPPPAEQEDVARTAISAFLEASLHGRAAYRAFFARPMAGREWLPDDVYLVRSDDGRQAPLVDVATDGRPADGLVSIATGLRSARNMSLPLRALQDTQQGNAIAALAWDAGPDGATVGCAAASGVRPRIPPRLRGHLSCGSALANATARPAAHRRDRHPRRWTRRGGGHAARV